MKAQELRIGNILSHDENWNYAGHFGPFVWSQRDWYALGECTLKLEDVTPVPLTQEWLLKFGFVLYYQSEYRQRFDLDSNTKFGYDFDINGTPNGMQGFRHFGRYYKCEHVHQLQNLYFAMTGEELINQTDHPA